MRKEKVQDKVFSDYKWPYMDSYVPQAKMLQRDADLIRASMAQEHFTSPISDKGFGMSEL